MSEELAWAAGLFEGEGSIHKTSREPAGFGLSLTTTDSDVLAHFWQVVVWGSVTGPYDKGEKWRSVWTWNAGNEEAAIALERLLPYLGKRRTETGNQRLTEFYAYRDRVTKERPCRWCKKEFTPKFHPSSARVVYCGDKCKHAFNNDKRREKKRDALAAN